MRRSATLPALLVLAAIAGCITDGNHDDATYRLMGWFNDWNDDIEADFSATLEPYDVDALLMESFPPGFSVSPLSAQDCAELRAILDDKAYLASVGDCTEQGPTTDGDGSTSDA